MALCLTTMTAAAITAFLPRFLLTLSLTLGLLACGGGGDASPPTNTEPASIASVAVTIPPSSYAPSSAELGGYKTLQTARVLCGFGALRQDTHLDAAALNHARYLTSESIATGASLLSHLETNRANSSYKGYAPWDRTRHPSQFYGDQVAEILESTTWDYDVANPPVFPTLEQRGTSSMINLLNTVYHLQGALFDGLDVGFGADLRTVVNGTSRREEYRFGSLNGFQTQYQIFGAGQVATYPCQGSANVPTLFAPAYESPNPFPSMTSTLQVVGPPIYIKADAGQVLTLTSSSISSAGVAVPTTVLTQANDPARDSRGNPFIGRHEAFVVPTVALAPNTVYQVSLAGTVNGWAFNRSFTLRTEP
ncbi:MAG: hypothetical protein CO066_07230 [Comamonadaceae bacterium CG_4_9_14_0_8_um_filter_60_18]|nr:MAG: hypothetical protein CO066_07230 [Comamonadaceae bacterium CG_4_9_14_0_8_um_filter_60_18]